ncbi:MAG: hypothetical protein JW892_11290 [Anaerolineae bacterium]|nr:hypothetical protein [Anaerolineae bacterium]
MTKQISFENEWVIAFTQALRQYTAADTLRDAALHGRLGAWTAALTDVVVETCATVGWQAAAKGHPLDLLPEVRHEYLSLDVMAFPATGGDWRFPIAVMELENSRDDTRIAYSLWKVLCVRAALRVVFCYRPRAEQGAALVHYLGTEVVGALPIPERMALCGGTLVVVGSRGDVATFPYGFFKWWVLDKNVGAFAPL